MKKIHQVPKNIPTVHWPVTTFPGQYRGWRRINGHGEPQSQSQDTLSTQYLHSIYTLSIHHLRTIYTLSTHSGPIPRLETNKWPWGATELEPGHTIYTLSTQYLHTIYTSSKNYLHSVYTLGANTAAGDG